MNMFNEYVFTIYAKDGHGLPADSVKNDECIACMYYLITQKLQISINNISRKKDKDFIIFYVNFDHCCIVQFLL